jgi:hypothetical protein
LWTRHRRPHLGIRWEVLNLHCGDADPVHLQREVIFVAGNVSDGIGLPLKELLAAFGDFEGFRKIGHAAVRCNSIRPFRYGHVRCKKPGERIAVAPLSIA